MWIEAHAPAADAAKPATGALLANILERHPEALIRGKPEDQIPRQGRELAAVVSLCATDDARPRRPWRCGDMASATMASHRVHHARR